MLANSFMKAEALGLSEDEQRTLIRVLGMLERGEIGEMHQGAALIRGFASEANLKFFDMATTASAYDCGTAGCILGWVWHLRPDLSDLVGRRIPSLFLPAGEARGCRDPGKAAIALRNYLTTGEPRWAEALAE